MKFTGTFGDAKFENYQMFKPRKIRDLAQEDFDHLLAWLDEDRARAGLAYEKIRSRLVTIFAARGCPVAEELADETIDRVARRVVDIAKDYEGDKARYFFGVANNVHHEYLKRPALPEIEQAIEPDTDKERIHDCLDQCLNRLPASDREMILRYYSQQKRTKVDLHNEMAQKLDITINTLRLRVLRMKQKLQPCVARCLKRTDVF
jgi:DNA-directed RNA polymerase specialized sigma24 family protein